VSLTPKQARFVEEYLVDLNATQAAIRAGYSAKTANEQGSRLLANASVAAAVYDGQKARSQRTEITADRVLQEYAKIGFANMLDYIETNPDGSFTIDMSKLTREQAAAISEVTAEVYMEGKGDDATPVKRTKFKLADKKAALDSIARHVGMFTDKTEHSGPGGGPIPHELTVKFV
jgi:phage terminase small subunit